MSSWYQQSRAEFRRFIEALGRPWACDDCGATDKPLSAFSVGVPPPMSELQKMASFDGQFVELDYREAIIARSPLLCVKCRHARERLARRLAAAGVVQGWTPSVHADARQYGYGMPLPRVNGDN